MTNKLPEYDIPAIWRQAFRPFFLAGSLFSIIALTIWVAALLGKSTLMPYPNIVFWHGHEMLFGFVGAIIVGFLLTAVQNWTGLRSTHGKPLIALFSLWLLARMLMMFGSSKAEWFIAVVDVSFFFAAGALVAQLLLKARNHRNLQFIPVLILLGIANLLTHLSAIMNKPELFTWGMYGAIMLAALLMIVVGGRVIPLFTASGTKAPSVKPLAWLENLVLISAWLIALIYISNIKVLLPNALLTTVFATAAASNAYRAWRWRGWSACSYPLVWSLHIAYWFIPVGFGLFALQHAGYDVNASTALHSLTVGAMGTLILSMISRVSLGHSGRPLVIHPSVTYAFLFIIVAAVTRILVGLYPDFSPSSAYLISAICWILAYGIFIIVYFRILTTPRPDGKFG